MKNQSNNKMKLGIDAKWYFKGPPSGNMVVKNLVDEMVAGSHPDIELYLFITKDFKQQAIEQFPGALKLIFLPAIPNLLNNVLLIPMYAQRYKLDAMLFQNFNSIWPKKLFKVVYIHDVLFLDHPQYYSKTELFYFRQMKGLAAKSDLIITISNTERDRLIQNNVAQGNKVSVIYHGVNTNFKVLANYSVSRIKSVAFKYHLPPKYLLYVGRVNIRKNISSLVSAIKLLDDKSIKLVIVGEQGSTADALKEQINTESLNNRVIFTGHVPEEDLYVIYANATVFCFPSYAEGFGLPPLEAMQCGVPVIVSNRTAMPEICGSAATYINPDDTGDIAHKVNDLLNDIDLYKQKVIAGVKRASEFTWLKSANGILKLISDAHSN
ncbi:glycosyltransferase family 4 protein [Mucilaginibacter flavus]|uniref:glycosyltransferase family 4 protein n=1 Tax=Mucilaginibacter flavus TaxID=931504 RepID=UPI0025B61BB1|nr:glycosyltransferase family 1 protein [Mucilaginibacter flavus]MDN3584447.1 glycosyltransferase family 1 protein [Mucilaginibacter flavus]